MQFEFEEKLQAWGCECSIQGKSVMVRLMGLSLRPLLSKEDACSDVLNRIETNYAKFESKIVEDLWETHNKSWAEPEDGYPELSKSEFLKKLSLNSINYDVEDEERDAIWLYYSDSGIFGNHSVEVFFQSTGEIDVELVG